MMVIIMTWPWCGLYSFIAFDDNFWLLMVALLPFYILFIWFCGLFLSLCFVSIGYLDGFVSQNQIIVWNYEEYVRLVPGCFWWSLRFSLTVLWWRCYGSIHLCAWEFFGMFLLIVAIYYLCCIYIIYSFITFSMSWLSL